MNIVLWEYCAVKSKTHKTLALFTLCCVFHGISAEFDVVKQIIFQGMCPLCFLCV
jgi:hypothetical protein